MKSKLFATGMFLLLIACAVTNEINFVSLFDGKSWDGWEGAKDYFRLEDQAIVAGTLTENIPKNQFLCTEKTFADFELRMKVKFNSTVNNAGIQFRTSRIPDHHEVIGYQADVGFVGNNPVWGSLYDESRRNRFLKEASKEQILKVIKANGWNDYRIYCKGPNIKLWLNESLVLEYEEEDENIAKDGIICVQIHGGKPAEAWYKDIEIQELN